MQFSYPRRPVEFVLSTLLVLVTLSTLQAQEQAEWKSERKKIQQQINKKVNQQVQKMVNPRQVAKSLGLSWPVPESKKTEKELLASIEKRVQEAVDRKYPLEEARQRYEKEAEKEYTMYEKGDKVSFVLRGGIGRGSAVVDEPFIEKTESRVHCGRRWVIREDMSRETQARFYKDVNKQMQERYVRVQMIQYKNKRERYADRVRRRLIFQEFPEANYIYNKRQKYWIAKKELLDKAVAHHRKQKRRKIKPKIEEQVFKANNYVLKDGQWMPQGVAAELEAKLKGLAEQEEAPDDMMPPGGDAESLFGPAPPEPPPETGGGGGGLFDEQQ